MPLLGLNLSVLLAHHPQVSHLVSPLATKASGRSRSLLPGLEHGLLRLAITLGTRRGTSRRQPDQHKSGKGSDSEHSD